MYKLLNVIGLLALSGLASLVNAAEIEVKMLNKGSDGEKNGF
jgi:hypothetical protein